MKKLIALFLAVVMLFTMAMTGCSSSSEEPAETAAPAVQEQGGAALPAEPVKLTAWIKDNTRIEDFNTNDMTLWLEEHGNFDLELSAIPSADFNTKINMALTAGAVEDLPDVILGNDFSSASIQEWADAGTILPLTQYYQDEALSANIREAIARTGVDYTQQLVMPDGEIYTVAQLNQSYGNEYPAKMWFYKPWLEALGAEAPTTTEELYNLLKQVSETDLNGNGKHDEIGLLGASESDSYYYWFPFLMNSFVYAGDKNYLAVNDGVVSAAYTTEQWKTGLEYVKKMFDEGIILEETLTMADEQFTALLNSADHCVFAFCYNGANLFENGETAEKYVCVSPVAGPENVQYAVFKASATKHNFLVTANCKNPEAAFKLGDLMSGEVMSISTRWGTQGKDWDYAKDVANSDQLAPSIAGFDVSIVAYDDKNFWGGDAVANSSWRQVGPFVRHYGIANGVAIDPSSVSDYTLGFNAAQVMYQNGGWKPDEVLSTLIYTADESDVIAEIESNLKTYVDEYVAAVMVGNKNLDADWDAYVAELENIGLEEYLEVIQAVYDRMYK